MKNKNRDLFITCHNLTKKLVENTKYNYQATFTLCLRLYYKEFNQFVVCCASYNIDVVNVSNYHFGINDFFANVEKMDFNTEAEKQVKNSINFSVFYGLKKRNADMSRNQIYLYKNGFSIPADSASPVIVENMKKNEIDDIKQDIFLYMLKRKENKDFRGLPQVIQLMRAGDAIVTSHYNKIVTQCKNNAFSMDDENRPDLACYDSVLHAQAIIDKLVANTPVKHRDLARKIIALRYNCNGRKEKNINEIAILLNVSIRTVKSVISEMKNGLSINDFMQD